MILYRGITIMQPYAELIALDESDTRKKRVENRPRKIAHRGPLLIHAGKSRDWMDGSVKRWALRESDLRFGAIIAIAELWDCVPWAELPPEWQEDPHAHGPWCWMLRDVRRLSTPIPWGRRTSLGRYSQMSARAVTICSSGHR